MADEANENLDSENQATEEVVENTEVTAEETTEQPEFTETEKKLYARTKKAEADAKLAKKELAELKKSPPEVKTEPKGLEVSLKDQMALMRANIHEDDIEEVMDYAKYKGVGLSEALKSSVVQATLKEKVEQRKTAEVTNTQGSRRTTTKVSDETLVDKAERGDWTENPEDLVEARFNLKKKK